MRYISKVREFHEVMKIDAPPRPGLPGTLGPQCRTVRLQLIAEEFAELSMAQAAGDLVGCLDALADLEYVVCGTLVSAAADRSTSAAMLPTYEQQGSGPPRVPGADLFLQLSSDFLFQLGALSQALAAGDWQGISGATLLVRARLANLWAAYRVPEDLREALFDEVHRSNMTKLDKGKPVIGPSGRVVKGPDYEKPQLLRVLNERFPSVPTSEKIQ